MFNVIPNYTTNQIQQLLPLLTPQEQMELDRLLSSGTASSSGFNGWLKNVSPTFKWDWLHLLYIQQHLDKVTSGEIRKLMIFVPPQHGKSECATIRYPIYRLEQNPHLRVVIGAYSQTYANRLSRNAKRIAVNRLNLSKERNAADEWETVEGGGLKAVGVGSGITGRPADLIIIDDPVKSREEADSPTVREKVYEWWTNDLFSRRQPETAFIIIQTRWHEDDLAGRILNSEDGKDWTVISLPAIAEESDILGRVEGEALCPERFDEAALAESLSVMGERHFAALYQQRPRPLSGNLFKRDWFDTTSSIPANLRWVRFWDIAVSSKATADETVGAKVAIDKDGHIYVADMVHGRWDWPEASKVIKRTAEKDGSTTTVGIEIVGHGLGLWQEFIKDPIFNRIPVKKVGVDKDKVSRAMVWAAKAENGFLHLQRGTWNDALIDQCLEFPNGLHDDRVDSISGAVSMLSQKSNVVYTFD